MALQKVTYVAHETIITADNLNDIQDAILEMEGVIDPDTDPDYEIGCDEIGIYFKEKDNG